GVDAQDTWSRRMSRAKIDRRYHQGGDDIYPLPLLDLDKRMSNLGPIFSIFDGKGIGNLHRVEDNHVLALGPLGTTHIAASLQLAIGQLIDPERSRNDAKKAIVLFTDGVANEPLDIQSANSFAMKEAQEAFSYGIPIYTVGFAQNPDIIPAQEELL